MNKRLLGLSIAACALFLGIQVLHAQDQPAPASNPSSNQAANPSDNLAGSPSGTQPAEQPDNGQIVIPEGTEFKLQLHTSVNSRTSKAGDRVLTTLLDPVSVEDTDVLPKGVRVDGHVGDVKEAARRGRGGYLTIVFDTVEMSNGEKVGIQGSLTEVFSASGHGSENVGPEGDLKGGGPSRKEQAALVLAPVAAGAAGGLATGIVGGAAGIAMALLIPKGKQASLLAGSLIGMRLDRDVTVSPSQPAQ